MKARWRAPRLKRCGRWLGVGFSTALLLVSALLVGQASASPPRCTDANPRSGGGVAALKPTGVLLAISSPRAGEVMPEVMPAEAVTVAVEYWGPPLHAASGAHQVDDYHLVFFLDSDDAAYVGTLLATPRCDTSVVHSATASATFEHVAHGSHTVYVMLVGSNDVSVNPPVAASTTFALSTGP